MFSVLLFLTAALSKAYGQAPNPALCSAAQCNFDAGTICNYNDAFLSLTTGTYGGTKAFTVTSVSTGNRVTGIPGPAAGSLKYAGVELGIGQSAVLYVTGLSVTGTQTVNFKVFEATQGITLKACVNTKTNCPYQTNVGVAPASERQWLSASFTINSTATTLIFSAENTGNYLGCVGIDNIAINNC